VLSGAICLFFTIIALTLLTPLTPLVDFHGGLLSAILLGSALYAFQKLWSSISGKLMGIAPGTCPMPSMMKWVVLNVTASVIVFIGALGLLLPHVYTVHGIFAAVGAGVLTVIGEMLSNFVLAPLRKLAGK